MDEVLSQRGGSSPATDQPPSSPVPGHRAFFYRGQGEYAAALVSFIRAALADDGPVLVAVPASRAGLLRGGLATDADRILITDMTRIGRNPASVIPVFRAFADRHGGRRVSVVSELAWPGRGARELVEATKSEALVNLALSGVPAAVLCPYDASGLPASVLADAERTHPELLRHGRSRPSGAYLGPAGIPESCRQPLPLPPPDADSLSYLTNLQGVRGLVARRAARAGLPGERAANLVLAVSEVAANTFCHTPSGGMLHVWHTPEEVRCQIDDQGWITDPLSGHRRPAAGATSGQGLWLVNEICDLVEVRTGESGTAIRLHMGIRG